MTVKKDLPQRAQRTQRQISKNFDNPVPYIIHLPLRVQDAAVGQFHVALS
jgi:hypothetical protein